MTEWDKPKLLIGVGIVIAHDPLLGPGRALIRSASDSYRRCVAGLVKDPDSAHHAEASLPQSTFRLNERNRLISSTWNVAVGLRMER